MSYLHTHELREAIRSRLDRFEARRFDPGANRDGSARSVDSAPLKQAAVALVLLPGEKEQSCFLLTRRASGLRRHGGQWAIPGGRVDPTETVRGAALRELEEELGIPAEGLELLGALDDFRTRSGFVISPLVFWRSEDVAVVPDPVEVASVHRVTLAELDHPDAPILTNIPESDRPVLSMPLVGQRIHAPTAAILYQLLEVALRGNATRVAHFEQPVFAWQ